MAKQITYKISDPIIRGNLTLAEVEQKLREKYPLRETDPAQQWMFIEEYQNLVTFKEALSYFPQV